MANQSLKVNNLPVYTVSGEHLGKVVGVEVEATAKQVMRYEVATALSLVGLWGKKLLISPEQVVSISKESMIVADAVMSDPVASGSKPNLAPEPSA